VNSETIGLSKFFAVDSLDTEYPWNSPYLFSENNVLDAFELEGLESKKFKRKKKSFGKIVISLLQKIKVSIDLGLKLLILHI